MRRAVSNSPQYPVSKEQTKELKIITFFDKKSLKPAKNAVFDHIRLNNCYEKCRHKNVIFGSTLTIYCVVNFPSTKW